MFDAALNAAGVGKDFDRQAVGQVAPTPINGRDSNSAEEYVNPNFISFEEEEEEDYFQQREEDPRLSLMQQQLDQMASLVKAQAEALARASAPAPQMPSIQQPQAAPIDYYAGYDPVDFAQQLLEDPDKSLRQSPALRQMEARFARQEAVINELKAQLDEQSFFEKQKISDFDERASFKEVMMDTPESILRDAHNFRKQQKLEAAKAAQGADLVPAPAMNRQKEIDRAVKQRQQRASGANDMQTLLQKIANRQRR
jgi:uncharacterized coiled-coil protein SlyX